METQARDLVVVITHGIDDELSSVGLFIALGGMKAGLKESILSAVPGSTSMLRAPGVCATRLVPSPQVRSI